MNVFYRAGSNKQKALNICCLEILIYLHKANKINNKNQAVFYDKKEIERLLSEKIFDISTSEELAEENGSYVENFHEITGWNIKLFTLKLIVKNKFIAIIFKKCLYRA